MDTAQKKRLARQRRHRRVRNTISGTAERPRLNVFRSLKHIYGQVIDDRTGQTLVSASTLDREVSALLGEKNKTEQASIVGQVLARRALDKGISRVVFDRGGWAYHGRVKALADGARQEGLEF
jgi:large subunit ribosomal protein L18